LLMKNCVFSCTTAERLQSAATARTVSRSAWRGGGIGGNGGCAICGAIFDTAAEAWSLRLHFLQHSVRRAEASSAAWATSPAPMRDGVPGSGLALDFHESGNLSTVLFSTFNHNSASGATVATNHEQTEPTEARGHLRWRGLVAALFTNIAAHWPRRIPVRRNSWFAGQAATEARAGRRFGGDGWLTEGERSGESGRCGICRIANAQWLLVNCHDHPGAQCTNLTFGAANRNGEAMLPRH